MTAHTRTLVLRVSKADLLALLDGPAIQFITSAEMTGLLGIGVEVLQRAYHAQMKRVGRGG